MCQPLMTSCLPKSIVANAIDKGGNYSWTISMWTACPPKDTWHPWVGWGQVTSNRRLSRRFIWTPLHSTLTLPSLWWALGCWTTIATWKPRWVRGPTLWFCVWVYCCTLTYICHTYIDFPFHVWHYNPLWSLLFMKKIHDSVLKQYQNL